MVNSNITFYNDSAILDNLFCLVVNHCSDMMGLTYKLMIRVLVSIGVNLYLLSAGAR